MDEEEERLANELADRLIDICEEYSIEQVSSATFTIMMSAIDENEYVVEKTSVLSVVLTEVSKAYNKLIAETRRPMSSHLH